MSETIGSAIKRICAEVGDDPTRLMDVARAVQAQFRCVTDEAIDLIAQHLHLPRVDVEGFVTFYAFLSKEQKGRIVIRLSNDIVDRMHGFDHVAETFCEELGIGIGETTPDGAFTLETTSCIGLCDQPPSALVNDVPVTSLSSDRVREIVRDLRQNMDPSRLVDRLGDGANAHGLVRSMVENNIREAGPLIFSPTQRGVALRRALVVSPLEVIRAIKTARLRGRGGAGFPTGMKWDYARAAEREGLGERNDSSLVGSREYSWEFLREAAGEKKFVICNADEGEPGTFKDRVILTERPDRVFAGMTIAGYAIGAGDGIVYLRAEYVYLREYLEHVLEQRRKDGLLGRNILGKAFNFDIRIQLGAGAYICGEETALINSCEGRRGDPRNRPPFPAQSGYRGFPTVVNNVETLCCVAKILENGPASFCEYGSPASSGTKVLSVSGDCRRPGIYEVPFGVSLRSVLALAEATDAKAVQVGGPSGHLVGPDSFDESIFYEGLATGGALVVFGPDRDILEIVDSYLEFFIEESCGYCTPCRVGNVLLKQGVERIRKGLGEPVDLDQLIEIGRMMKATSRCGLGQTSPNPVLTSLGNFRAEYDGRVEADPDGFRRSFDLESALHSVSGDGAASTQRHD